MALGASFVLEYLSIGNVLLGVLFLFFLYQLVELYPFRNMPPGPRFPVLPLLGHGLKLDFGGQDVTEAFESISRKYGQVYSLKLGKLRVVVASNSESVKEVLVTRSGDYAGRSKTFAMDAFTLGGKDIAFANYGPAWRLHRKLFMTALRQYLSDVPLIERRVSEQVENLLAFLESKKGEPFDPTDILAESVANVICGITFGEGYDTTTNEDMRKLLELNKKTNSTPDLTLLFMLDFFPLVEYLPLPPYNRLLELSGNIFDIIRKHLKERRENFDPDERVTDLITGLIQAQNQADDVQDQEKAAFLTDDYLVNTIEDMFSAGYETTSVALRWALVFLVNYPQFQVEIQQQLDEVVGRDRDPSLGDRPHLPLINATIIEILRLGNIAAQTIPHVALKDTKLCGYDVPKDTVIIVNTESVHLDPKCWENPYVFNPHRHIDENGQLNTNQGNFYPFGAGRRVCAGEPLAKVELFLFLSWMLHRFKFEAGDEGPPKLKGINIVGFTSPLPYKVRAIKRQ